jgi:hypothetical protein
MDEQTPVVVETPQPVATFDWGGLFIGLLVVAFFVFAFNFVFLAGQWYNASHTHRVLTPMVNDVTQ